MHLRAGAATPRRLVGIVASVLLYTLAGVAAFLLWPTSLGGCTTLTIVSGHSMEPTYYTGDLVVARCATAVVGDVIVYQPKELGGARIIHRITGGDATTGWVMQGDNNAAADPFNPAGSEVLGVAKVYLPKVGLVARGLTSPFVWVSFILIAIGLFVWPRQEESDDDASTADQATAGSVLDAVGTDLSADALSPSQTEPARDEGAATVPSWVPDSVPDSVHAPVMEPR
ncbi:signal peptidase I [Cellulomonas sp. WB94]|uniref:signal peptidase I n=1 Tax=Cellulomonas sp. WB94 TaxID=2173174 RepID=UPI000D57F7AD|nr:signal peptidase I [Cellulomonas sp. WB94]PVU83350.1 signal peptidase I [Cellulomonas sp. WB94]